MIGLGTEAEHEDSASSNHFLGERSWAQVLSKCTKVLSKCTPVQVWPVRPDRAAKPTEFRPAAVPAGGCESALWLQNPVLSQNFLKYSRA